MSATDRCLKQEKKAFWYLLNYDCIGGVYELADTTGCELLMPSDCGAPNPIASLDAHQARKNIGHTRLPIWWKQIASGVYQIGGWLLG